MPGSDIPPYARAGLPHHGQLPDPPAAHGAAHPCRASPANTDLHHPEPTGSPVSARQEKYPTERWDLQEPYLYRLDDIQGPEDLPNIWKTLDPLTKERARPAFGIACRESARALRCKAPRVTHAVAVLLLGLHFHTEDPDCVNDTVKIFQFPDLSLSVGSKTSTVN